VKIKICGLFREEDVGFANEAGPDYVGFVFAESRRQVSAALAARLRGRLDSGIVPVGVFVNAPVEAIAALYRDGVIAMAQLHGDEDGGYIAALKELTPDIPVIKAVRAERVTAGITGAHSNGSRDTGEGRGGIFLSPAGLVDYLLLDSGAGGTGTAFDWKRLAAAPAWWPPWFLAGGIGPHNIEEAVRLKPYGIDVSSGAESGGFKDRDKMIYLVHNVKEKGEWEKK
jgi:phosphoribosylanthranilate isomerase